MPQNKDNLDVTHHGRIENLTVEEDSQSFFLIYRIQTSYTQSLNTLGLVSSFGRGDH
jgi:hypothetical protein